MKPNPRRRESTERAAKKTYTLTLCEALRRRRQSLNDLQETQNVIVEYTKPNDDLTPTLSVRLLGLNEPEIGFECCATCRVFAEHRQQLEREKTSARLTTQFLDENFSPLIHGKTLSQTFRNRYKRKSQVLIFNKTLADHFTSSQTCMNRIVDDHKEMKLLNISRESPFSSLWFFCFPFAVFVARSILLLYSPGERRFKEPMQ